MANKKEYIICPLPLIKNLIADGNTIEDILLCGIFYRAMNRSVSNSIAKETFIRCYFEDKAPLPPVFLEIGDFAFDPKEYNRSSYYPGKKDLKEEFHRLNLSLEGYYGEKDPKMLEIWYKCYAMLKDFGMMTAGTPLVIARSKDWFNEDGTCKLKDCPTFLCNYASIFKLYEDRHNMDESRRALWTMYFAIMSIVGTKKYVGTTSQMIKTRLAGAKSKDELADVLASMTDEQRALYEKYTTIRRYNYMMEDMRTSNMIVEYGAGRRTYISVKLTLSQLCEQVMTGTRAGKNKILKMKKQQVEAEVKASIEQRYKPRLAQPATFSGQVLPAPIPIRR